MAFTRRHLPHWIPEEAAVFVSWRLAGSLPRHVEIARRYRASPCVASYDSPIPCWLTDDTNRSSVPLEPTWLQDSRVACVVVNALLYGETVRRFYQLHAFVVMPNHVHVIFQPHSAMSVIMRWLKGRTSRVANQILGRTGIPFWQDESFDHWVRSAEELQYLIEYVENNPVKAGLVEGKEQWQWSSAGWADRRQKAIVCPTRLD